MDNREAKFVLGAYRTSGADAADPHFARAIEQARRDPQLERWFEESIAFDARVAEKLRETRVPTGLRESILAGARLSRKPAGVMRRKLWAVAAGIVAAAVMIVLLIEPMGQPRLAGWQTEALHVVESLHAGRLRFDAQSGDATALVEWLEAANAPAPRPEQVPPVLHRLVALGCKTFTWQGIQVSLICFQRADGQLLHVVMTRRPASPGTAKSPTPLVVQTGDWATAAWRDGDMQWMLALQGSVEELRRYL